VAVVDAEDLLGRDGELMVTGHNCLCTVFAPSPVMIASFRAAS
jgi:hypothetical protein